MKSLQNQYNLISEGKGKKDVFLKEAKRLYPNLLTNSSNFNEAEAILKNKGVISENIVAIPAIGSLKDSSKQDWVKIFKENINEERQLTYNDFVSMVRDDMNAGAAPDEYVSDERIKADAKWYYNRYLQGEKVEDMFESINENRMDIKSEKDIKRVYEKDPDAMFFANGNFYAYTGNDLFFTDEDGGEHELKLDDIEFVDLNEVTSNLNESKSLKDIVASVSKEGNLNDVIAKVKEIVKKEKLNFSDEEIEKEVEDGYDKAMGLFENVTKTSKEVEDINAHGYDNADKKNLDNQIFDQYLNGLYVELKKDPELTMEKAREIVAKNLASDPIYYTKNAAFKVDGIGYTDEAPGLTPKEITGKYKASGYGDLKEQKLRKAIRSIIREELNK